MEVENIPNEVVDQLDLPNEQTDQNIESILESHEERHESVATRETSSVVTRESSIVLNDKIEYGIRQESSKLQDKDSISSFPIQRGRMLSINEDTSHIIRSNLRGWYNKPYMGGFRNKKTMIEYFHATTQTHTPQEIRKARAPQCFHRDTQTKFYRNRKTQATHEVGTQMTTSSHYVSTAQDLILRPQRYTTAEAHHEMLNKSATVIQCFIRKCFAIAKVKQMTIDREVRLANMEINAIKRNNLIEVKRKKELELRLHPKTSKDFEVLYNGLENWRVQETDRINRLDYPEPARLAALADLLDQEAVLLQKIDRLKIEASTENKEKGIYLLLEEMASPKKWPALLKTQVVYVDTPNTIRARELRDLYHALNIPLLSVDERLQILLNVKYTVKEFDCNLTREIVELIDREADLVSRGRDAHTMEGLRKRISNLFLQFIQTPEFNPEAGNHQRFPEAGLSWKKDQSVYFCRGCTKYLPSTEFYLSTTMKHLGKCKSCTTKENIATQRKDDSTYTRILKAIKAQEHIRREHTGQPDDELYNVMALLQETDIRHLIDVIWNKQSAISSTRNIEDLILTRWDLIQEISPWNCILLTKAEAATHDKQANALELYSEEFKNKVTRKHQAARQFFSQLPAIERFIHKKVLQSE